MAHPQTFVTQILVCRLRAGGDRRRALALTQRMVAWLRHQPGFLADRVYDTESGWVEQVDWSTAEAAQRANQAFSETEMYAAVAAVLDRDRGTVGRIVTH
jgi:hypothetical protein